MLRDSDRDRTDRILNILRTWGWEFDWAQVAPLAEEEPDQQLLSSLLSWMNAERGDFAKAEAELRTLAEIPKLSGWAYLGMAFIAMRSRRTQAATEWLAQAEQRAAGDDVLLSSVLRLQGTTLFHAGKIAEARPLLEQAVGLLDHDCVSRGRALDALGMWYASQGKVQAAIDFFRQALDHKEKFGDSTGQAVSWGQLGRVYLDWGQLRNAERCFQADLDLCRQTDDRRGETQMHNFLGIVALARSDFGAALQSLRLAVQQAEVGGWRIVQAYARKDLAHCLLMMEETQQSAAELDAAADLFSELAFDEGIAHVRRVRGMLHAANQNWVESERELRLSLGFFQQRKLAAETARTRLQLARLFNAQGKPLDEIRAECVCAVHDAEESRRPHLVAEADQALADIDPVFSARHIYRRVRGRRIDEDVTSLTTAEQETVTIFFFDLQGFTNWSRETDAGIVMLSLNQMMDAFLAPTRRHDIQVIEYMGDGFLAMARGPQHARRAVLASFELIAALEQFNRPRRILGQPEFACRIGVSTGDVVLGNVGTYEKIDYRAVGTTVNLAARIQSHANTGYPCVSPETWRAVQDAFEATAESPRVVDLKGLGETELWSIRRQRNNE